MSDWIKINDENVLHVWINDETNEEVHVSPDFYQDNGEPCDDCGEVLRYSHTLIKNN
jgi:formamidopyrimidine-DNA glycosylase